MRERPSCPRCGGPVQPPGLWSSHWTCALHGAVPPVHPYPAPGPSWVRHVVAAAPLPAWVPWPLPHGWVVTGVLPVGDPATGIRATVVVLSGPNPVGGPADLLLVTEEPGVGYGARYAGLPGPDVGADLDGPPAARVVAGGRPTALWWVPGGADRAVYVGESFGAWLWLVLRPASAGALLLENLALADLRGFGDEVDLVPFGALAPWLAAG